MAGLQWRELRRASSQNRWLRTFLAILLAAHGLMHAMGVALMWRLGEPGSLRYSDVDLAPGSLPALAFGSVCLIAGAAFVVAAVGLLARRHWWPVAAVCAAGLSIAALIPAFAAASAGLVIDVAVVGIVVLSTISNRARAVAR